MVYIYSYRIYVISCNYIYNNNNNNNNNNNQQ